ncbi:MAG: ATP-grasp domain-containing protein [Desulfobacteraceae bacterium]|nr:ATP-grasp domain-containing protein [Desulfobacteraceae bacterium]
MAEREVVLVVGTTSDYIDIIRRSAPGKAVFITDPQIRGKALEADPGPDEELLCTLTDPHGAGQALRRFLQRRGLTPAGITSFDCESMEFTSHLAREYRLPYPSAEAIANCRDKYLSKAAWSGQGLNCPQARKIRSAGEAVDFFDETGSPLVLKPLCGSGSELVFRCRSREDCRRDYARVLEGLRKRRSHPLYRSNASESEMIVAEECIDGEEYSCDFTVDNGRVQLIRLCRKIRARTQPFGTIQAYILCSPEQEGIAVQLFFHTLLLAASSLQISRGLCMLDFIIGPKGVTLLEIAPRPGGDCLPFLLRAAAGLDILGLHLDFACGLQSVPCVRPGGKDVYAGLRHFAPRAGTLKRIDRELLERDPRVLEIGTLRTPGHVITLPPEDYSSWLLGYVIARLDPAERIETGIQELLDKIRPEIE